MVAPRRTAISSRTVSALIRRFLLGLRDGESAMVGVVSIHGCSRLARGSLSRMSWATWCEFGALADLSQRRYAAV